MSVVCVAWSSHVGSLMSAASRSGMPSVRVLSSRMLEDPDGVERCLEIMRSATALFVFRTTDALWDQLDEGIRLIGKTVPVVCVSYDPAAWALSSVSVETAQTAYRYLTYGGAENLGNLFRFLDALPDAAAVPEPVPVPWEGLWHPDAPVRAFATARGYLEWYAGYARERGLSLESGTDGRIAVRSALLGQRHARRGSGTCPCPRSEGLGRVSGLYEYDAGQGDGQQGGDDLVT